MPTITESEVKGYAHCRDPRCDGYAQEQVPAVKVLAEQTFAELGGKGSVPGVERSWESFKFADEDDKPCPSCGHYREITGQARPTYQPLSGFSQTGLLGAPKFNPAKQAEQQADRIAELESKLDALMAKLDADAGDGKGGKES